MKKQDLDNIKRIPQIEEFLQNWKVEVKSYFLRIIEKGHDLINELNKIEETINLELGRSKDAYYHGNDPRYLTVRRECDEYWRGLPNYFYEFRWLSKKSIDVEIEKILNRMLDNKRYMIISRTEKVVGEILDASGLSLGMDGAINGIIIGKLGRCRLETIMAGGYNIQCLHFRVLVKKLKD